MHDDKCLAFGSIWQIENAMYVIYQKSYTYHQCHNLMPYSAWYDCLYCYIVFFVCVFICWYIYFRQDIANNLLELLEDEVIMIENTSADRLALKMKYKV